MQNISLSYLFRLFLRRVWIIGIVAFIVACVTFSYFKFVVVPRYQATTSIYVTNGSISQWNESQQIYNDDNNNNSNNISSGDVSSSLSISYTVLDMLKTHDAYDELSNEIGGSISPGRLMGMISVTPSTEKSSMLLKINVTSSNGKEAIYIANKFANVCKDFIPRKVGESIKVYIPTTANSFTKVYPTTVNYSLIAALIGAVATYAICFVFDFFDQAIRGEAEFAERYEIPLLGSIPDFESSMESKKSKGYYGKGYYYGKTY